MVRLYIKRETQAFRLGRERLVRFESFWRYAMLSYEDIVYFISVLRNGRSNLLLQINI